MPVLIDYYPESNYNGDRAIYTSADLYFGEAFNNPNSIVLNSAKWYLKKEGSPTGIIYAQVYASTGTLGVDAKPTGSALATSDGINSSTLSDIDNELITFTFTGAEKITLSASTDYIVVIGNIGGGLDSSNYVKIGVDTTSPTYAGNQSRSVDGSTWIAASNADLIFYIYGDAVAATVTTQECDSVLETSVRGNGNITNTGGVNCIRRGFCYKVGTTGDPTTADSTAYDDGSFGTGAYTKIITNLTPSTNYRVRAYTINEIGTSYGATVSVLTSAPLGILLGTNF